MEGAIGPESPHSWRPPTDPFSEPFRPSGAVLVAGGIMWFAHAALMLSGFLVFALSGGLNADPSGVLLAGLTVVGSLFAGILASVLLGTASFLLGAAIAAQSSESIEATGSGETPTNLRKPGNRAGFFFLVFGASGILTIVALAITGLSASEATQAGSPDALAAIFFLWAGASVALVLAAEALSGTLAQIRRDPAAAWTEPPSLRAYAYVNLVGVLLLAIPLLVVPISPRPSLVYGLVCILVFGGLVAGFVAPLVAFLTFSSVVRFGIRMARGSGRERAAAP